MRTRALNLSVGRAALAMAVVVGLLVAGCASPKVFITPVVTPTPPPTPTPTIDPYADEAQAAKSAFATLIAKPGLSFHLEQALNIVQKSGQSADYTYVLDVSGKDVKAVIDAADTTIDLVILDHATWARERGQKWQRGKRANDATIKGIVDVWRYVGPIDQLEYVGRVDGTPERYRYRTTALIPYHTAVMDQLGFPGTIDGLELVLDGDGTPVEFQFHAASRPTSGGMADMAFDMTSKLEFSRVGKPVTITAPK